MTLGVVAIGRNEGERLRVCLRSVLQDREDIQVVYVDSGSTDGSVEFAQSLGVSVVALDMTLPFTAARARNEGFARLQALAPRLRYVQFVDGDCEVVADWMDQARAHLEAHPEVVAVCGRRRERFPERSVYNRLCDQEWDTPVGEAKSCGGDALLRADALRRVGGYREELIAGEEPELCVRLRAAGGKIWRLPLEMTLHDAAMVRFGQWWKRVTRAGFAFAQGAALHGAPPERHWVKESRSAWFWGLGLPLALVLWTVATTAWAPWSLLPWLVYPAQVARLSLRAAPDVPGRWARGFFLVLGKFAEAVGQLKFMGHRLMGRRATLIEYK
ncbi:MAG: glycosyltransferase family A protein [Pseudomonadota bacterium]